MQRRTAGAPVPRPPTGGPAVVKRAMTSWRSPGTAPAPGRAGGLRAGRLPFLALAALCLVAGLLGGLARLGLAWVPAPLGTVPWHGPLMVGGFLATLIGVERAAASHHRGAWLAPLATGTGGLLALAGADRAAALALAAGGAVLTAVMADAARRHRIPGSATQALAAAALAGGALLWAAGRPVVVAVPWWTAFLVLTIAGERLELSRVLRPPPLARRAFVAAVGLLLFALPLSLAWPAAGPRLLGLAWLALALWLWRFDLARRNLRRPALTGFLAVALVSGYVWLAVAGGLALAFGLPGAGARYDAVLHALLLGFVFSMIFGHAPVIFPAVLGLPIRFRRRFYAHLALLHVGLAVRVGGDLIGLPGWTQAGGLLNALAIGLFAVQTATSLGTNAAPAALPARPG